MGALVLILWGFLFFDYIIENTKEEKKRNKKKLIKKVNKKGC